MGGKMKKYIIALVFVLVSSPVFAQYVYMGQGPVTGNVYVMSPYEVPVPVVQPVPVAVPQPVPVPVPVRRPVCTSYPDPWDTLGYIFGDPFMITTCY